MEQEKGPLSWLKKLFSKEGKSEKKYQYLIVVLLFGAAIMVVSNTLFSGDNNQSSIPVVGSSEGVPSEVETLGQTKAAGNDMIADYEQRYETQLKEALEGITGVSDVMVAVNVDATEMKVLEKNTVTRSQTTGEKDREGGERTVEDQSQDSQTVIVRNGEKEVPIVLETKKPEIRGVLVVAKGADNIQVKKWIIESVTKLLDVPVHRVSVMPKK
ncbi:stage III sporulation protein AG [Robertmurraya kyonggiensis]|uniref:Stage III sporulation protein AG n=1 Tax=Robertmurraya kyonggiensis TaxID=1037680 RepID=A0A4U1DC94_9BACI|nr:stage III sporulation protein AG [Robertmurraya kyonggiensis]TKC19858.1 stage III sporulation protein AG [Robertmurraya kyonggiensis]